MKTLVTGASGPFGRTAVRFLLERVAPNELILLSRTPEKLAEFARLGCETRYGDFKKPDVMRAAMQGAERALIISAYEVGHRIPQHTNAIHAARDAGVKRIVYTSYMNAVPENKALIAGDHSGTEAVLRASGVSWTAMRDGMYAETMTVAAGPAALRAGKWVTCSGDGRTSFVDRRQAAECAVVALTTEGHDNKVYNITGAKTQTFAEVAEILTEITGKPIEMLNVSDEEFLAHLDKMGIPRQPLKQFNVDGFEWCGDDMLSFEVAMREGWWNVSSNDIQLLTGKRAKTLRDFCLEHADGLRAAAR